MKSEFDDLNKINEFNNKKIIIREEDESYSDDLSFAYEQKLCNNLIDNFEKNKSGIFK